MPELHRSVARQALVDPAVSTVLSAICGVSGDPFRTNNAMRFRVAIRIGGYHSIPRNALGVSSYHCATGDRVEIPVRRGQLVRKPASGIPDGISDRHAPDPPSPLSLKSNLEFSMRTLLLNLATLAIVSAPATLPAQTAQPAPAAPADAPTSPAQVFSYGVGHQIGTNLKSSGFDVDLKLILKGLSDALAGKESSISEQQFGEAVTALRKIAAQKALERGKAFLAENAKKPGVKTTKSGLQYLVLKAGTGETPTTESTVETHYKGRLITGSIFDSSYQGEEPTAGDQPIRFQVGGVIKGWTEALQLMKVGDRWRLFIPSNLAYGEKGAGQSIGPNETLIFDIELVGVK